MTRKMPRPYHAAPRVVPQPHDPSMTPATPVVRFSECIEHIEPVATEPEPAAALQSSAFDASAYTQPFISFMNANPTVYHAVAAVAARLKSKGFSELSERDLWADKLEKGGKYFFGRHGSSLIAFTIGENYEAGNGAAIIAAHIDSLAGKVKPVSTKPVDSGVIRLGVGTYGGSLNHTWFDRDLGIGGRVLVRNKSNGKIESRLAKIERPIGRIPSLAPHFGLRPEGSPNPETRMVPIIGLDNSDLVEKKDEMAQPLLRGASGTFASTQPERLVRAISKELGVTDYADIVGWELEVFDTQPAQVGGLDGEFIFAGRIDDKLCSWAAVEGLLESSPGDASIIKMVGLFDDEEIGSLQRQGARGNLLPSTMERICEAFADGKSCAGTLYQTYANSFLVSADVCHAYNPNYGEVYLRDHSARMNVGVAVAFDSNAHMTTDGPSYALLSRVAERADAVLQITQIRNDGRGGGTVGPMLAAATGMRAIDAGIVQLSMHSIRATTGDRDPGLGVQLFKGFFDHYEEVDREFQ